MKNLLIFIALAAITAVLIKDTPLAEKLQAYLIAFKRHVVQITAEQAAAKALQSETSPLFALTDLHQDSETGVRTIAKGTQIHIVTMAGDEITITDGITIITTTPDSVSSIKPDGPIQLPGSVVKTPTPAAPAAPVDPRNIPIQTRIDELTAQIDALSVTALYEKGVRSTRAKLEIERLSLQRTNLERQLH